MITNFLNKTLLLLLIVASTSRSIVSNNFMGSKPGCPTQCGHLTIPYPFGVGPSCSLTPSYSLECDKSYNPSRAFTEKLNSSSYRFRVFEISDTRIRVNGMIAFNCPPSNDTTSDEIVSSKGVTFLPPSNSPFTFSNTANKFSLAGSCDYFALVSSSPENKTETLTCRMSCLGKTTDEFDPGVCSIRNGCCKLPIRNNFEKGFSLEVGYSKTMNASVHTMCSFVFVGVEDSFALQSESDFENPTYVSRTRDNVAMVVDWVVVDKPCLEAQQDRISYACQQNTSCIDGANGGYRCACLKGYRGNPYLSPGCTDINECAKGRNPCYKKAVCLNTEGSYNCTCPKDYHGDGHENGTGCKPNSVFMLLPFKLILGLSLGLLCTVIIASGSYIMIRTHKLSKKREKFFKQNGGLMLKEKLASTGGSTAYNTFKLFTMKELERATKNFSKDLIVGVGGYGTVYKGTLKDDNLVAIKVSKIADTTQTEQFINEMVILTQIHHRNVVRLLGCCLEAPTPILVYEYIANGSLLDHIHGEKKWLSWKNRLQIATETATALGYLHSSASTPIIHRDIKTSNILLDENYIAKISDFGASRLIPMDQTQMSTLVQGTLGYIDPEYLLSSQLTDKSDVYSFGVVVAELLTGQRPLSTDRRVGERNLGRFFVSSFKQGVILDIIDPRLVEEAPQEQLLWVAEIVQECLAVKGVNRPLMKDLAVELAGLERQVEETPDHPSIEKIEELRLKVLREGSNHDSIMLDDFSFTIDPR